MMIWKKAAALFLSAALTATLLAGCGSKGVDPIQEAMGYSKDTVFATIEGSKITAEDYLVWLAQYVDMYTQLGGGINWDEDVGDGTLTKDFLKTQTMEMVKQVWVIESLAKEEGVKLSDEDKKAYQEQRAKAVEEVGGEEAYQRDALKARLLTEEKMESVATLDQLGSKLEQKLCHEGGKFDATADALRSYMEEQGILKAKHILLLTKDPAVDGPKYSAEKIAEQKKKADGLLVQLRAAENPTALFDELMKANSEDSGLEGNPNGYLFSTKPDGERFTSRMVTEFEEGTQALEFNQISDVIESEFGYHIILRLDPTEGDDTVKGYYYEDQMGKLYEERTSKAELKTTTTYEEFDAKVFYEKLTAYRETLKPATPPEDGEDKKAEDEPSTPEDGAGTTDPAKDNAAGDDANKDDAATSGEDPATKNPENGQTPENGTEPPA